MECCPYYHVIISYWIALVNSFEEFFVFFRNLIRYTRQSMKKIRRFRLW